MQVLSSSFLAPSVPVCRRTASRRTSSTTRQLSVRASAGANDAGDVSPMLADVTLPRRALVSMAGTAGALWVASSACAAEAVRTGKVARSEVEWREMLSPESYRILRQARTELPFTSPLNNEKRKGTFVCAGCKSALYDSSTKFDSGTGWPSFFKAVDGAVREVPDFSIMFLPRAEIRCATCEGHLGHVFDDGPAPTGMRYCMNGAALEFVPSA